MTCPNWCFEDSCEDSGYHYAEVSTNWMWHASIQPELCFRVTQDFVSEKISFDLGNPMQGMQGASFEEGTDPEFSDVIDQLAKFSDGIVALVRILKKNKIDRDEFPWF